MNFKLNEQNGKVKYILKMKSGNVGSDTTADNIYWLLKNGTTQKSEEIPGYPISITVRGDEYLIAGEWLMGGEKDILGDEAAQKAQNAPQKKRKTKDAEEE